MISLKLIEMRNKVKDELKYIEKGNLYQSMLRQVYFSIRMNSMVKKAKYKMAFTMDDGFITPGIEPLTLPRVGIDRTHTFAEFKTAF